VSEIDSAMSLCTDWPSRHPEWLWCDDFEIDRLRQYFEYDIWHGRFVRQAGIGVNGSVSMRAEYLPCDPHAGFLHVAFGRTPIPYISPVDEGIARYTDIYWRFDIRYRPDWRGGGGGKLTRAMILATDRFAQAGIGHLWSGAPLGQTRLIFISILPRAPIHPELS
jgi:hypothetical protein